MENCPAGSEADTPKYSVKVAMQHGISTDTAADSPTIQPAPSPASMMESSIGTPEQREASGESATDAVSIAPPASEELGQRIATSQPAVNTPVAPAVTKPTQPSEQHMDSDTESEDDLDAPFAAKLDPSATIASIEPSMKEDTGDDNDPLGQDEESQNGISSFPLPNQTPQKQYGKSRKRSSVPPRESSTASTIPDSVRRDGSRVSTSFVAAEAAARSLKKTPHLENEDVDAPAEEAVSGNIPDKDAGVLDDEASSSIETPTMASKKSSSPPEAETTQDGAGSRLFKAAKHEESSLDEIVVSKPNISKLKTPSRPSMQKASTRKPSGPQRANKIPATPAPASSYTPSSGKIPTKVLLSSSTLSVSEKTWLKKQTAIVDDVPGRRVNFLCVVRDRDLPSTVKVLRSLIADKPVVCDQWVTDSKKSSELLDPADYLHTDLQGSDIKQTDRRQIWKGKTLFFTTPAAKSYGEAWEDIKLIATDAGANAVQCGNANKGGELLHDKANTILFGADVAADRDARALISEYDRTVYDTKMFSTAIIKADVDLSYSGEFKLVLPSETLSEDKPRRGRSKS